MRFIVAAVLLLALAHAKSTTKSAKYSDMTDEELATFKLAGCQLLQHCIDDPFPECQDHINEDFVYYDEATAQDIQLCPDMDAAECLSAIGCDTEEFAQMVEMGVAMTLAHLNLDEDPQTAIETIESWAGGCKVIVDCMGDEDACDEDTIAAIAAHDDPEDGVCQDGDLECLYMEISCPWVWAVLDAAAEKEKTMKMKKMEMMKKLKAKMQLKKKMEQKNKAAVVNKAAAVKKLLRALKL